MVRDLEEQRGLGGSSATVPKQTKPKVSKQKSLVAKKTKKATRLAGPGDGEFDSYGNYVDDGEGDEESVRLDDIKQLKDKLEDINDRVNQQKY